MAWLLPLFIYLVLFFFFSSLKGFIDREQKCFIYPQQKKMAIVF